MLRFNAVGVSPLAIALLCAVSPLRAETVTPLGQGEPSAARSSGSPDTAAHDQPGGSSETPATALIDSSSTADQERPAGASETPDTAAPATEAPPAKVDPLRDAGVAPEVRRAAIAERAKASGRSEVVETLAVIEACDGCPGQRDLVRLLALRDAAELADEVVMKELIEAASSERPERVRIAAARAINVVPEEMRPPEAARFAVQRVEIVCVPGQMRWEPKDISVTAGTVVEIAMRNDDTMQHNLLIIAPSSLSEIGVAADRIGTTLAGKEREYVPDSPKVLHVMGLVDPGETGLLWFFAPTRPATYPLVCTYPGHWRSMNGRMRVTRPAIEAP
ncbi:MAG: hypothetical protein KF724_11750 [Phycisphaeraceae bacterium]|nr:hypothetical protein [Phycisphaeraceae bacterium]